MQKPVILTLAAVFAVCATPALAQIKIGVSISATGPAASLGIPERNALSLAPKTIAGKTVEYIVLDDASDPTAARRNIERFVNEDKVDLVIGSSTTPASLAMVEVAGRSHTPMISLGAGRVIIFPIDDNKRWVFKTPYNDSTTAAATAKHMKAEDVKTVSAIAVNDAYGQGWVKAFAAPAEAEGIKIEATESYESKDTSATAQVLKALAVKPDAVLITASGTPGTLPQIALAQRDFKGKVYQTTGVVNADFLRVGGKAVEGTLIAADPLSIASELPPGHPAKEEAIAFVKQFDAAFGAGSTTAFAGYAWDAVLIAQAAIAKASIGHTPGSPEFRAALRDAIEESKGVVTTAGPVTMSAEDHNGYSADAPTMVVVKDGKFTAAQ
jgi:branched-chain amino acid transport system substrate-binding protein